MYPISGAALGECFSESHYPLALSLGQNMIPIGGYVVEYHKLADYQSIMKCVLSEVESVKPKILMLSSEFFVLTPLKNLADFVKDLSKEFQKVKLVLYVRRQDEFLESYYKQTVRDDTLRLAIDIKDFIEDNKELPKYYEYILRLKEYIEGEDIDVIPLIYDRKILINGNIVSDFFERIIGISIDFHQEEYSDVYTSLSPESTIVLYEFNLNHNVSPGIRKKIIDLLLTIDQKNGSVLKYLINTDQRIKIIDYYRESNERLFEEFFNSENRFVLNNEDIENFRKHETLVMRNSKIIKEEIRKRHNAVVDFIILQSSRNLIL
ncbi:MAG: hypothetical protein N2254_01185 [bacterium]|nr:hypothetical protein [bacterium]